MPQKTTANVTIKSIARDMRISFSTVSKALNNSSAVKKETRLAVLKRACEMGYSPNLMARGLRSKTTKTIGAIFNDIENVVWVHIFKKISIEIAKFGYTTLIGDGQFSQGIERAAIQSFLSLQPDFIILSPAADGAENIAPLSDMLNRVIVLRNPIPGLNCHCIDVDYSLGGYLSAAELFRKGHRELLILTGDRALPIGMQYLQGIRSAYKEFGVPFDESRVIGEHTSLPNGCRVIAELWDPHRSDFRLPFTGVLAFDDLMACGVYRGLKGLGMRIPEDVSVIGFDNNPLSEFSTPALSTVHLPVEKMADCCLSVMKAVLLEEAADIQYHYLKPELIPRESVRPL